MTFLVCGAIAFTRVRRTGLLMAATGAAWLLGSALGGLVFLHRGPLVHLLVTYPHGRLRTRLERAVVGAAYVTAAIQPLGRSELVTIALLAAVVALVGARHAQAGGALRRAGTAGLAGAVSVAAVLGTAALLRLADGGGTDELLWAYEIVLLLVAAGLCADLVRGGWSRAAITGLIVDLAEIEGGGRLRARLARSVGDPALELGYWRAAAGRYEDEAGGPIELPPPGGDGRSLLEVRERSGPLAAIVHDPSVLAEPELADAVIAAVRIAVANERLGRDVAASVEQVRASRRRLVEAAGAERERLEAELRDAAKPRLDRVDALLRGQDPELEDLRSELEASRAELTELARGIHPRVITEAGLPAALEELASRAPIPVTLHVDGELAPGPAVATAVYFLCSEALANAAKHAGASSVGIRLSASGGALAVEVSDDGRGGADTAGSGLVGLADRVEALGGRFAVDSPVGAGTRLTAELTLERAAGESAVAAGASA